MSGEEDGSYVVQCKICRIGVPKLVHNLSHILFINLKQVLDKLLHAHELNMK